jgi:hypothetical protein
MKAGRAMLVAVLVALAAAVALTSVAGASPDAAKQRVAITSKGVASSTAFAEFVFAPLGAGTLKRDTGTETSDFSKRVVMRQGQRIEIEEGVTTSEASVGPSRSGTESNGPTPGTDTTPAPARGSSCAGQVSTPRSLEAVGVARCTWTAGPGAGAPKASSPFRSAVARDGRRASERRPSPAGSGGAPPGPEPGMIQLDDAEGLIVETPVMLVA